MLTKKTQNAPAAPSGDAYQAILNGNGAVAQGGGTVVGAGATYVGGSVNTGGGDFIGRDRITNITHGVSPRDLEQLFASLSAAIAQHAPADKQALATQQAEELKSELTKGKQAEDRKIAGIIDKLAEMAPGAVGAVVSLFTAPILDGIVGPVTKYVLDKFSPS